MFDAPWRSQLILQCRRRTSRGNCEWFGVRLERSIWRNHHHSLRCCIFSCNQRAVAKASLFGGHVSPQTVPFWLQDRKRLRDLKCLIVHKSRWHTLAGPRHATGIPRKRKKRPPKSLGLGSDTRVHVVCGCALVSLLLHCFDALIWLLRFGRGPAARRIEDTHQTEIDNWQWFVAWLVNSGSSKNGKCRNRNTWVALAFLPPHFEPLLMQFLQTAAPVAGPKKLGASAIARPEKGLFRSNLTLKNRGDLNFDY